MTNREKFQALLRELFQFDCADLDFGIYRIMNYKRDVIEKFISTDLPELIGEDLNRNALADQSQAAAELAETAEQITETLGKEALDADGNLAESYHGTPLGKKYLSLQAKATGGRGREALEATIFNHLYTFFSRYYQDGDFISKRRYSKRQKYAIPYNGEEVYLHWANHDQYYVKTAEHFHDYTFTSQGVTVQFKLTAANVEQNNVKGEKRLFLPRVKELDWREKANELIIPFEYRPLTEQEKVTYGKKNQQDKLIAEASEAIPRNLKKADKALAAVIAERRKDGDNQPVTFLEHHLRQYTRKNTSDFFIHKDLKGFLSRELDFYLKNEVLNLDEMEAAGEGRSEGWFQVLRVIKAVGSRISDFLDQIESFQKMLWEKRKFITETQYCITVGTIDESFYPEIAECDAQWDEWRELFHIDEEQTDLFTSGKSKAERRVAFLKAHPTLLIDTSHFAPRVVDALLASFGDLEEMTDGELFHSENWQALNLLSELYSEGVSCIYIDPPFNSPSTRILYKNDYLHSSWLALMSNRIDLSRRFLADGVYVVAIDENEQERLGLLIRSGWLGAYEIVCVAVRHNPRGIQGANFSHCHEYAYFMYPSDSERYIGERKLDEVDVRNLRDSGLESDRTDARNCFYPIIVKDEEIVGFGDVPPDEYHPAGVNERDDGGLIRVWPIDTSGNEKKWRYARQSVERILPKLQVRETRGKHEIYFAKDTGTVRTLWDDAQFDASEYGTKLLQHIFGRKDLDFSYPKSLYTLIETLRVSLRPSPRSTVLDYFGGSGTTAHATIGLNREDGGNRKFILVEMGDYFQTVLLPRIKKIAFAPEWKDGKPARSATAEEAERGPRIIKYCRVESFEDTLNNIAFDEAFDQGTLQFEDYLLKYMLKWETRTSETLLNIEKLAKPFSYKLTLAKGDETIDKTVDIPETFNYLLGLHVSTRKVYDDDGRRYLVYHGRIDHRRIAVIWRETEGWQKKDLERDKKFVVEQKLAEGVDEVFVNGDSFIPNAKALEPVFKARMFAPVEA
ncbi:DNA methyltransferase [Arhodomonas aquaeolei]|uniref:DNA methyltransferase n=1 Tax=Arhodomonas aquaeolei TaxID=2369 RepID=UPI000380262F|nr:DNA methyltransferase [Arhodomonas aquaeolei]